MVVACLLEVEVKVLQETYLVEAEEVMMEGVVKLQDLEEVLFMVLVVPKMVIYQVQQMGLQSFLLPIKHQLTFSSR